jgi:hypothetical protein
LFFVGLGTAIKVVSTAALAFSSCERGAHGGQSPIGQLVVF